MPMGHVFPAEVSRLYCESVQGIRGQSAFVCSYEHTAAGDVQFLNIIHMHYRTFFILCICLAIELSHACFKHVKHVSSIWLGSPWPNELSGGPRGFRLNPTGVL